MFGTYSLWEGIDIPGESLNCLIMVKIPFDSPRNPLIEARVEYIGSEEESAIENEVITEENGENWNPLQIIGKKFEIFPQKYYKDPYLSYYYPLAIMRLKQGFGRLIRNKTDRGVFIILDRRLKNSESYSNQFLNSLPLPIKDTHKYIPFKESLNEIESFCRGTIKIKLQ